MSSQNPILLVTGIRKSQGDFTDDNGRRVEFSSTVVTALTEYSAKEKEQGAIGFKSTEYKIKGAQFFQDYISQALPNKAELIFNWDFTGKTPKAVLLSLNFNLSENADTKSIVKSYEKSAT